MSVHPIQLSILRELVDAGAVQDTAIVGQKGGYAVVAKLALQDRPLATKRGTVRVFGTTDAALRILRKVGITRVRVDAEHYEPARLRPARKDVSQRAAQAAEALAHDRWFRAKVQESLDAIEDGSAVYHDHDALWDELEAIARAGA